MDKLASEQLGNWVVYQQSLVEVEGTIYFLCRGGEGKRLGVVGDARGFRGEPGAGVVMCPLTPENAAELQERLPWLRPRTLGLRLSAGCGDRLGLATPGHVRAVRAVGGKVPASQAGIAPIWAQQSMRENARTGRTPQQVMDEAMWGLFQEGWREPWGADADHLKTIADVDSCVAAGYTFFTVDPGDHVDNQAHTAPLEVLESKVQALPWDLLGDSPEGLDGRYSGRRFEVEGCSIEFSPVVLLRAAAKYGQAIAHTARMYRHLAARVDEFELEMSVDETETPTSVEEHWFIASELGRLGVHWVSLAPRYVGRFEKGVDYIGSLAEFEAQFAQHAAIARALGPYKLSLHSGSDKFSIYPIVARHTRGLVHLKTAGTSYLEALRTVAGIDPAFFREIFSFSRGRYETDRATYHVSAQLSNVPSLQAVSDADLPGLLDQFDTRQVLHVTFGSVLEAFGARLLAALQDDEEAYYARLEAHFRQHLRLLQNREEA
ncbi:MAG: hypothetical protein JXM73_18065 [Anaerolineae bacterium]|nr:hypothetical protein [Anaerolineae bacterium]